MTNGAGSAADDKTALVHRITHVQAGILPFRGILDGKLSQPIEVFIQSVENHLIAKKITSELDKFLEAKAFLDFSKGDIAHRCRSFQFKNCTTWNDLKKFLRKSYGAEKRDDIVHDLRDLNKLNRGQRTLVEYSSQLYDAVGEFVHKLEDSPWVVGRNISLDNLWKLLHFSKLLEDIPDIVVNNFDAKIIPTSDEDLLFTQVRKHMPKVPTMDTTVFNETVQRKPLQIDFSLPPPLQVQNFANNNRINRPPINISPQIRCFNCNKLGHTKSQCRSKYCGLCRNSDHYWKSCPFQTQRNTQPTNQNYRGSKTSRGGYSNTYTNRRNFRNPNVQSPKR